MSDDPLDVDTAVADLYREPPDSFVAGRDALARALRAAKRRDEAAAVGKLRRPSRVAWAFNAALAADADLGARLDDALAEVTAAGEGRGSVRSANNALRSVVDDLVEAAARTSSGAGHDLDRSTLTPSALAVVGDPESLAALQAGRLGDVPTGGGFGFGLELPAESEPAGTTARAGRAERTERPARRSGTAAKARDGARAAPPSGRKAGAEADRAAQRTRAARDAEDARLTTARRAVERAEGDEATAAKAVDAAEAVLDGARAQLRSAEADRADAEAALADAQERLATAKRDIAEANRAQREADKGLTKALARRTKAAEAAEIARAALDDLND